MHHETGERAQHLGGVVRLARPAALGVRDGDDAVDRRVRRASGCSRAASWRAKLAVRDVVPRITIVLRVPTPRPPGRR